MAAVSAVARPSKPSCGGAGRGHRVTSRRNLKTFRAAALRERGRCGLKDRRSAAEARVNDETPDRQETGRPVARGAGTGTPSRDAAPGGRARGSRAGGAHGHGRHRHARGHGRSRGAAAAHAAGENESAVKWAAVLTAGFMAAEFAGGLIANSLTLIADAVHMLTDSVALGLAWWAFREARRPATPELTYGRDRMPVLIAFANGIVLLLLTAWITWEAIGRLLAPEPVAWAPMLAVAWLGLLVNVAAFLILSGGSRENLNIRGALLHVLSDLLGSVAAIVAGTVILLSGWTPIDPILSLVVAGLILRTTARLLADASHVLLEGAPRGATGADIARDLDEAVPGVARVHHVHAWSISEERLMATLHAELAPGTDPQTAKDALRQRLADRFGVDHVTIEIEEPRRHHGRPGGAETS